jgi:aspartate aminotransferase
MSISRTIQTELQSSSWIRKMFETGQVLRGQVGDANVFDFSLGSPILEPPAVFVQALKDLVNSGMPGLHRYMPNAGYLSTRQAVAQQLTRREGVEVAPDDVVMTVGAAGAINVALSAILECHDEALILAPYFVEYTFYARNHGGEARVVETTKDFDLDLEAIEAAIGDRTKAIIINTPNNPTGKVYSQAQIAELSRILERAEHRLAKTIYLLFDTPYGRITFDGHKNPLLLVDHPSTLIAHSFSKELGLSGQRIGYLAISPRAPYREALRAACTFTNRTLGYVNAPALMQLAVERSLEACVDVEQYQELRDVLCDGLEAAGYELSRPQGAFYLFAKTPIPDDIEFTYELKKENVLVVPGSGFGRAGHMRIAYCVTKDTIARALPRFARAIDRVRAQEVKRAASPAGGATGGRRPQ